MICFILFLQQCAFPNVKMVGHVINLDCVIVDLDFMVLAVRIQSHKVSYMCSIGKICSHNSNIAYMLSRDFHENSSFLSTHAGLHASIKTYLRVHALSFLLRLY